MVVLTAAVIVAASLGQPSRPATAAGIRWPSRPAKPAGSCATCRFADNFFATENPTDGLLYASVAPPRRSGLRNPFCTATGGAPPTVPADCATLAAIEGWWNAELALAPTAGDRAALVGAVVRLAFHDAGEFDGRFAASDSAFGAAGRPVFEPYGPDGCMSAAADHAGLTGAADEVVTTLEPGWQMFCDRVSRADFWVIVASYAAMGADPSGQLRAQLPIKLGRSDNCNCDAGEHLRDPITGTLSATEGRMPLATRGLDTIEQVFVTQMGLSLEEATALLGAHSLGGMSTANSGFGLSGAPIQTPWVKNNAQLSNDYYVEMVDERWDPLRYGVGTTPNDMPRWGPAFGATLTSLPEQQWHNEIHCGIGPAASTTCFGATPPKTVMLNADMALAFSTGVETAPTVAVDSVTRPDVSPLDWCGMETVDPALCGPACAATFLAAGCGRRGSGLPECCAPASYTTVTSPNAGLRTRGQVDRFRDPVGGNQAFLAAFASAFDQMTSVGYGGGSSAFNAKLGPGLTTFFAGGTCPVGTTLPACGATSAPTPAPSSAPTASSGARVRARVRGRHV